MPQDITAQLKHLRIAPRKTRLAADVIRGLPVQEAEGQLLLSRRRASTALLKLLRSAVANAKNNNKLESTKLYIKEIRVDQGPVFKRFMPRAFGRVSLIEKKTSHITLVLGVSDKLSEQRFVIKEKPKKKKDTKSFKKQKEAKEKFREEKVVSEAEPAVRPGLLKRIFRRKSI